VASHPIMMHDNGPRPAHQPANPGDTITWTNKASTAQDLTYPACVSNGGSIANIPKDGSVMQTVNNGATTGPYTYSYKDHTKKKRMPQNGTIDVS